MWHYPVHTGGVFHEGSSVSLTGLRAHKIIMTRKLKLFGLPDHDNRGVSPVIGVILMVAITVILAAVIASFVLGFGSSVSENVQAGADISEKDNGDVGVTWISEGNAETLNVTVSDATDLGWQGTTNNYDELADVGNSGTLYYSPDDGNSKTVTVTVTAVGSGGSKTVVTQEEVTVADNSTA